MTTGTLHSKPCRHAMTSDNKIYSELKVLFHSKICYGRILDLPCGAIVGVHAFGYNSAESEPIWMNSGARVEKNAHFCVFYNGFD